LANEPSSETVKKGAIEVMGDSYDAIVVGSGATGGWAAKELTEGGLRVALLEAGPMLSFDAEAPDSAVVDPGRQSIQSLCYAFNNQTSHLFVDDVENPYSFPEEEPFNWIRSRQVGGRLHVWGRMSLRMSDFEFKAASRDGIGEDWPISYADLAPYYDRVEQYLKVCGTPERLPQLPDGDFLEPPPLSTGEQGFKSAVERQWSTRNVTSARMVQGPPDITLVAAMRTGRLTLYPNSVASQIVMDGRTDRARSVAFVDRVTRQEGELDARVIVLCASTIESTRLLLNSATPDHPGGLANSSGALGHYLMDHTYGIGIDGIAPQRSRNTGDRMSYGCVIPAFRNITEPEVEFVRGYGVELQVSPPVGGRLRRLRSLGRPWGGWFWMRTFGEVLPRFENHVSVDPVRTDAWGIPAAHIVCRYGENELRMAADQLHCLQEMAEVAGFHIIETRSNLAPPGLSIHEMGTARMGSDPDISVLNPHNQSWDVRNLFVTDGACFTSSGFQNPTLTMMAITVRACDHVVEKLRKREL
jgi:choline dehydrogenase-like flavoprotein